MRDKGGFHRKVQELIDCFATTDPLRGMAELQGKQDQDEAALMWLAFAVLHGINADASEISILKSADGTVRVVPKYRRRDLPPPSPAVAKRIFEVLREITHADRDRAETLLALGIRDGSAELMVKQRRERDGQKATLKFF